MKKRNFVAIGIALLLSVALFYPLPAAFRASPLSSTRIEDRAGRLLYDLRKNGLTSNITNVPLDFRRALIAAEDRSFSKNIGVSIRGTLRALLVDLRERKIVQGGSSLTQQYVRQVLQPEKRGFLYKIREAVLAIRLTLSIPKEEILSRFVSGAYFGQQAYGLEAAARTYFDTTPDRLSLAQSALLAGLLNAPSALNPFNVPEAAKIRRNIVLKAMLKTGVIQQSEYVDALAEPLTLSRGIIPIEAPHFVFWLLEHHPDLRVRGSTVRTTLDLDLQHSVEDIVRRKIDDLKDKNVTSAAVVVLDVHTGDILSMVGSPDYFESDNDGAVNGADSLRQPGSALKPFTYALAFGSGMTPATTVADISTQFFTQEGNPYIPRNYDFREHGLVRLRDALANSYNIPAVKVLERIGVSRLLTLLQQAGIGSLRESPEHYGLALTLGDAEVTLLDLTAAYGIFPRMGFRLFPRGLADAPIQSNARVIREEPAWLVTDILSDENSRAAEFGRGGALSFDVPVAAKTGTTRNSRDNWTVGYTPDVLVGVWVGNPDNTPMRDTSGITGAGPIFHDVMLQALKMKSSNTFQRPTNIVDVEICRLSGLLPTELCTDRMIEHFIKGTEPTRPDELNVQLQIDRRNQKLAGPGCDPSFTEKRTYVAFGPELSRFARENNWPLPPLEYSPFCPSDNTVIPQHLSILTPLPNTSYKLDPLIPDTAELVIFTAQSDAISSVTWYVDDVRIGEGKAPDFRFQWLPVAGVHEVRVSSGSFADHRTIEVRQ